MIYIHTRDTTLTLQRYAVICRLLPPVSSLSFIFCMCVFLFYLPSHFRYLRAFAYSLSIVLSLLLCLRAIPFSFRLVRKLPWLSRQSDRLLTDRSLVRSQAEAPFLLFTIILLIKYTPYIDTNKKYASRGSRTHDRAVKSRALYRLS